MAAPINVPANQKAALQALAGLSDAAYEALQRCLADGRVWAEPDALLEQTSKALEPYTSLGGQILGAVVGMRSLVDRANMTAASVASGVAADAMNRGYISPDSSDVLARRLSNLLDIQSVVISAKAFALTVADAAPFADARIVSDIRPIFSGTDALDISGSVIIHHLHIEVGGQTDDQRAALTTSDLQKLKRVVERALEKDKRLRETLRHGALTPLEPATLSGKDN